MKRKTLLTIIAVLGGITGVFATTFGLTIDAVTLLAGVTGILLYVFWEAKADIARVKAQLDKWKDPKFWITVISAGLVAFKGSTGIAIPAETIVAVLTVIVGFLFKAKVS